MTKPTDTGYEELLTNLEKMEPGLTSQTDENHFASAIQKQAIDTIIDGLSHDHPDVRIDAAEALGRLKTRAMPALTPLKQIAEGDSDGTVRQAAAIALIQIGGDALLAEVTKNLEDDNPEVIAHAAVTLGKVGDPKIVPNLLKAFQTDDQLVGSAIAWALGQLADSRALTWLAAALENGFVAANAAEALGRIGDPEAIPIVIDSLYSDNEDTRAYAARALGMIKAPENISGLRATTWLQRKEESIDALCETMESDPSRKVRIFASIALFELGHKQAGQQFISLVREG